jgi:para-aminobenzoate synthetase component 1
VAGYFDGSSLESCVLIRFIEETPDGLVYRSGGGVTIMSDAESEYAELLRKVYVPAV